jgi:cytidine deaminase
MGVQESPRDNLVPINWPLLRQEAKRAAEHAYAPYSRLHVGAAGLTNDGSVLAACNVENSSYGLTLCAECGLVSMLRASGASALVAVSIVAGDGAPLAPCGRCRQVLIEQGGAEILVDLGADQQPVQLGTLLPWTFGAEAIEARHS